eukprot:m.1220919 g.1220919  ORF g.1220919 m.1220919 type:complete len:64 (+) comp24623_c0_seq10:2156-2347(+)
MHPCAAHAYLNESDQSKKGKARDHTSPRNSAGTGCPAASKKAITSAWMSLRSVYQCVHRRGRI